jgi:hypothetical protein
MSFWSHAMMGLQDSFAQSATVVTQLYEIQVGARLDPAWMEFLPVVEDAGNGAKQGAKGTSFVLRVVDQAELMGIINSLHGFGLCLLSVRRLYDLPPAA